MTAVISAMGHGWYRVPAKLNPSAADMFASWWTGGFFSHRPAGPAGRLRCRHVLADSNGEMAVYRVIKQIDFCYGHRLLDYDGICRHPHGHNAVAEVEVRTDDLDRRGMVVDFADVKRIVKGWIDREIDHRMILRHDDPLVSPLRALGEPMYLLESNPTVERLARLIFEVASAGGLPVTRVTVWETPTSSATYTEPGESA